MSGPAYVVAPIGAGGSQQDAVNAAQALASQQSGLNGQSNQTRKNVLDSQGITDYRNQLHADAGSGSGMQGTQGQAGPLKQAIGKTDSLYKYINWEDPLRTIGSYFGALGFLFGLHYFPLTQLALKAGAIVFGIMSVASFVSRSFNTNSTGRVGPREYRRVPEDTLNATLKDVHDFVQYAVVQGQRIVFGEDLNKTFAAFVGTTALFWLTKVISPFGLSVVGLTSVYLATLLSSPQGRQVAQEASARAGDLANTAAQSGKQMAQDGANQAAALSSKARDTVADASRRTADTAQNGMQSARDQVNRAAGTTRDTVNDTSRRTADSAQSGLQSAKDQVNRATGYAQDTASNVTRRTGDSVQSGQQSVLGGSNRGTGQHLSGEHPSTVSELPEVNNSSLNRDLQNTRSSLNDVTRNNDNSLDDMISNTNRLSDRLSSSQSGSGSGAYDTHDYTHAPGSNATGQALYGQPAGSTLGSAPRSAQNIGTNYDARFDAVDAQGAEPTGAVNTAFPTTINSTRL